MHALLVPAEGLKQVIGKDGKPKLVKKKRKPDGAKVQLSSAFSNTLYLPKPCLSSATLARAWGHQQRQANQSW